MKTIIPLIVLILTIPLMADGFKDWKKSCYACHKELAFGAKMQTNKEWEMLFANGAEKLRMHHIKNPEAMERLDSSYFKRHLRTLRNILMEFASDKGGMIRSCDGAGSRC